MPGFPGPVEKEGGGQAIHVTAIVSDDAQALQALGECVSSEGIDQVLNES